MNRKATKSQEKGATYELWEFKGLTMCKAVHMNINLHLW